ncbi:Translation initiation factor 1A [Saitozyma podzolica]|uniref:Translation initiation factor 1A n=1 Tax=Saitozyma podzolica TaxID=1890683 RepID=A0A427YT85_9TREE|nr:Translation initiation factor 1A [Saitozyma podzolica]
MSRCPYPDIRPFAPLATPLQGGKNRRRGKNEDDLNKRELIFKEDGQEYAQVVKMLGNGRIEAKCQDGETRLAQIRGQLRKKVWITAGDIILLSLREFQDDRADVIHRYTPDEARNLKTYGELKNDFTIHENAAEGEGSGDEDEDVVEFGEAEIDDILVSPPGPTSLSHHRPSHPIRSKPKSESESESASDDQATIFLYVSPTQWVKAGVEFDNGKMWDGSVVTNPYSDWAIARHTSQSSKRFTIAYNHPELKIFQGDDMVREVKFFGHAGTGTGSGTGAGADNAPGKVFVGIMGCSPKEGGAEVVWERFEMREGVRE